MVGLGGFALRLCCLRHLQSQAISQKHTRKEASLWWGWLGTVLTARRRPGTFYSSAATLGWPAAPVGGCTRRRVLPHRTDSTVYARTGSNGAPGHRCSGRRAAAAASLCQLFDAAAAWQRCRRSRRCCRPRRCCPPTGRVRTAADRRRHRIQRDRPRAGSAIDFCFGSPSCPWSPRCPRCCSGSGSGSGEAQGSRRGRPGWWCSWSLARPLRNVVAAGRALAAAASYLRHLSRQ